MSNIKDKVQDIFKDIFEDDTLLVDENTTAEDIEEWDSLSHINLVGAIEKEFNIKFALGELQSMRNVGEMLHLIDVKTA